MTDDHTTPRPKPTRPGDACTRCGRAVVRREGMFYFRGASFAGLCCEGCNAGWDTGEFMAYAAAHSSSASEDPEPEVLVSMGSAPETLDGIKIVPEEVRFGAVFSNDTTALIRLVPHCVVICSRCSNERDAREEKSCCTHMTPGPCPQEQPHDWTDLSITWTGETEIDGVMYRGSAWNDHDAALASLIGVVFRGLLARGGGHSIRELLPVGESKRSMLVAALLRAHADLRLMASLSGVGSIALRENELVGFDRAWELKHWHDASPGVVIQSTTKNGPVR